MGYKGDYSDRWDEKGDNVKIKDIDEIARTLGVNKSDFYSDHEDDFDQFRHGGKDDYFSAVKKAANNNYDMRRSIEAANLAGKDAPNRIRNLEDAADVHRFMAKTWDKQGFDDHGAEGFNHYGDMAAVTNYYVNKDREGITDRLDALEEDDQQTETAVEPEPEEPVVLSDRAQDATDFVGDYSWAPNSTTNTQTLSPFATTKYAGLDDSIDTDMKDKYTLNIVGGLAGAGIPTRGAGAPGTPGGYGS